jgi:hypothetical protein
MQGIFAHVLTIHSGITFLRNPSVTDDFSRIAVAIAVCLNVRREGVRSFAQLVKHVAVDNYVDAASLLREKPPIDVGEHENGPDSIESKAQILQFVRDSFAYMQKAIRTVNQDNLMEPLQFAAGASDTIPRLRIVDAAMAHPWDIYGQMIEYLRMTGIDPQAKR